MVVVNVACIALNIRLNVGLIPRYGAVGVAIAASATLFLQNVLNQIGFRRIGIPIFERRYAKPYVSIAVGAVALWAMERLLAPPLVGALGITACVSFLVLLLKRSLLRVTATFPEIARLPLIGALLR